MKIRTRLQLNIFLIITCFILISAISKVSIEIRKNATREAMNINWLEREMIEMKFLAQEYLLFQEKRTHTLWRKKAVQLKGILERDVFPIEAEAPVFRRIENNFSKFVHGLEQITTLHQIHQSSQGDKRRIYKNLIDRKSSQLLIYSQELFSDLIRLELIVSQHHNSYHRVETILITLTTILLVIISISFSIWIYASIAPPLSNLAKGVQKIAQGNLDYQIPESAKDELGTFAREFNLMTQKLSNTLISKDYLEGILESMADIIITMTPDTRIQTLNKAAIMQLGYSTTELKGKPFISILSGKMSIKKGSEDISRLLEHSVSDKQLNFLTKSGVSVPVSISGSTFRNEKGEPQAIVIAARDLRARLEVEAHLRDEIEDRKKVETSLLQYKQIVSNAKELMAIIDHNYIYQIANTPYSEMFGLRMDEIIQQSMIDLYGIDWFTENLRDNFNRCLKGESVNFQIWFDFPVKGPRYMNFSYYPLLPGEGEISTPAVIISGSDITELRQVEEALQQSYVELDDKVKRRTQELKDANDQLNLEIVTKERAELKLKSSLKEKETLLQEIHHRVKNNLNVVSGLLSLHIHTTKNEEVSAALKESQGRIYAMSAVHEILYDSENLAGINIKTYLTKISQEIAQTYALSLDKIVIDVRAEDVYLNVEKASPLGLVINELITNSLKYAFPDNRSGLIQVEAKQRNNQLYLMFQDNGVGMPDGFDWRNAKSLGLRLIRSLIETQLDGSMNIESVGGVCFRLSIPIETEQLDGAKEETPATVKQGDSEPKTKGETC